MYTESVLSIRGGHRPAVGALLLATAIIGTLAPVVAEAVPSASIADYVLVAGQGLDAKRLTVLSGDVAVNAGALRSQSGVRAPSSRVAADQVDIHRKSTCTELYANPGGKTGAACGPASPFSGPIFPNLAAACGFPTPPSACDASRPIIVANKETRTLAPGVYGDLLVKGGRGTLILEGGAYVFCNAVVGPRARVFADGPVRVVVANDAVLGPGSSTGPAEGSGVAAGDVAFFVSGGEARLQRKAGLEGTICVPNGSLRLMNGATLDGRGIARSIKTGKVTVQLGAAGTTTTTSTTSTTSVPVSTTTPSTAAVPSTTSTSTTSTSSSSSSTQSPSTTSTSTMATSTTSTTSVETSCGADGLVEATVELVLDETVNPGASPPSALGVRVDYPDVLEIPGAQDAPEVLASLSDLTGVGFIAVNDNDAGTTVSANYLEIDSVTPPNVDYGAIFRVQLQGCPDGTPLRLEDFPCTVVEVSDALGLPVTGVTCRVASLEAAGGAPTTTTSTTSSSTSSLATSSTSVTSTSTTSTTIVGGDACGNGMTVPPETCDDGNTENTDNCPSDCIRAACEATATPAGTLTVNVDNQENAGFGALTVFIDYPEGLVLIPGFGDDTQVQQAVTDRPAGSQCVVNDRGEHGLQFGCLSTAGVAEGLFFRAAFRDCANGGPPAVGNFTCTVLEAFSPVGAPLTTTCTLSLS